MNPVERMKLRVLQFDLLTGSYMLSTGERATVCTKYFLFVLLAIWRAMPLVGLRSMLNNELNTNILALSLASHCRHGDCVGFPFHTLEGDRILILCVLSAPALSEEVQGKIASIFLAQNAHQF
jgi:hypothetical protein